MKNVKIIFSLVTAISLAIFIFSCSKENDKLFSKYKDIPKNRGISLISNNRFYDLKIIDTLNNEYNDFNLIENRLIGKESFKILWRDSLLTMDSLQIDTLTDWVKRPCCDLFIFNGWSNLPFPPYTGIIGFTEDKYSDPSAVSYYKNVKLWVKEGNDWILNYNWNWFDWPEDCKTGNIWGGGFVLENEAFGCPNALKKVRIEKRWIDDSGDDHLCRVIEGTFYYPGYPWSPACF